MTPPNDRRPAEDGGADGAAPDAPRADGAAPEYPEPELPPTIVAAAAAAGAAAAAATAKGATLEEVAEEAGEAAAEAVADAIAEGVNAQPFGIPDRRQRSIATKRARRALKAQHAARRTTMEVLADRLTKIASSGPFLVLHAFWFVAWILWNTGALGLRPFDPYPFGFLTMVVSLEAIFLSIFVLMSQARESAIAELREEITLEVIFRMEEEVTKTLQLVSGLFSRLGYRMGEDAELRRMLQPLDADSIEKDLMEQLRAANEEAAKPAGKGARRAVRSANGPGAAGPGAAGRR
ncbi:MAG: DUF1003 domain-containing protein [Gemmatimonadaceae bacterium]